MAKMQPVQSEGWWTSFSSFRATVESWSITRVARETRTAYRASPRKWHFWLAIALGLFALLLQSSVMSEVGPR